MRKVHERAVAGAADFLGTLCVGGGVKGFRSRARLRRFAVSVFAANETRGSTGADLQRSPSPVRAPRARWNERHSACWDPF